MTNGKFQRIILREIFVYYFTCDINAHMFLMNVYVDTHNKLLPFKKACLIETCSSQLQFLYTCVSDITLNGQRLSAKIWQLILPSNCSMSEKIF